MRRKGRGKADKKEKQREAMAHLWVGEAHRLALEVEASHFLRRADVALGVVLERSVLAALIKKKRNETKRNETKRNETKRNETERSEAKRLVANRYETTRKRTKRYKKNETKGHPNKINQPNDAKLTEPN